MGGTRPQNYWMCYKKWEQISLVYLLDANIKESTLNLVEYIFTYYLSDRNAYAKQWVYFEMLWTTLFLVWCYSGKNFRQLLSLLIIETFFTPSQEQYFCLSGVLCLTVFASDTFYWISFGDAFVFKILIIICP